MDFNKILKETSTNTLSTIEKLTDTLDKTGKKNYIIEYRITELNDRYHTQYFIDCPKEELMEFTGGFEKEITALNNEIDSAKKYTNVILKLNLKNE